MQRPNFLRGCILSLEDMGAGAAKVLNPAELGWEDILSLAPLSAEATGRVFDHLAEHFDLGMAAQAGLLGNVRDLGIIGCVLANAPNWGTALEVWTRYSQLSGHPLMFEIEYDDDFWTMSVATKNDGKSTGDSFLAVYSLVGMPKCFREFTGRQDSVLDVEWAFPEPQGRSPFARAGFSSCEFGALRNAVSGPKSLLTTQFPLADRELFDLYSMECSLQFAEFCRSGRLANRVLAVLRGLERPIEASEMARKLALSKQEMDRRLSLEDTTYKRILDEYRKQYAESLLGDVGRKVKEISWQLGFEDPSSFRRAFRRWTGQSINQWTTAHGGALC